MALHYNDTLRNAIVNSLKSYVDGYCTIYAGDRPASPDSPPSAVLLATFNLSYSSASNGKISLSTAPIAAQVTATGTATWFRLEDGNYKLDGDVSVEGGGGDAILDSVSLSSGEMVTLKQMDFSISNPA